MDRTSCVPALETQPQASARPESRPSRRVAARIAPTELANAAMQRYARGDERAFNHLYRLLAPRLYRVCICLCGATDAADLMQEVFLKIHRARETFTPDGNVMSWAATIARTTFLDRVRYQKRRPEAATEQKQLERVAVAAQRAESADDWQELVTQLANLSENLRLAYWLVKFEGLSCAEAAKMLGTSKDAVKQRVHRASEALKIGLAEAGWVDRV